MPPRTLPAALLLILLAALAAPKAIAQETAATGQQSTDSGQGSAAGAPLDPLQELAQDATVGDTAQQSGPPPVAVQAGTALTEAQNEIDYAAWNALAQRAEDAIEAGRASDEALESLRSQVAEWRARFLTAQSSNQSRIKTIQSQIDALGAAPEEGVEEPPELAARRAELAGQLARLRAPVLAAEEAYNRANGLIGEIDALIRARQTDAFFELGPSPLVPEHWFGAANALRTAWRTIATEISTGWNSDARRAGLQGKLPMVIFLLLVAVVFLLRGRTWAQSFGFYMRENSGRGGPIFGFMVSVGQIVLPLIGLYALTEAISATGLFGIRTALLLEQLPVWGIVILGIRWLADRLFSQHDGNRMLPMERQQRREGRTYATILGILLVTRDAISKIGEVERFSEETLVVLNFPVLVLAALILFRIGQMLSRHIRFNAENTDRIVRARVIAIMGRLSIVIAIISPVLAATGYNSAADGLIFPTIATLALFGTVVVLQRFSNDLYRYLTRQDEADPDSLVTVLIGFLVALAAMPFLALIWGARVADLTELWTRFSEGVSIGDSRISPSDFLLLLIVFVIGFAITRVIQSALKNSILPKTKIDTGGQNAIVSGIGYVGIFLAAIISITSAGLDLSSLAIVAGALSVGIGFGLQNIVSNFVSGIILLIERPIAEGDWIEVGGIQGTVQRISVRSTTVETFDKFDVIIPNADFVSGQVSNYTRSSSIGRILIPVGVAYGNDTRRVQRILLSIVRQHEMVLMNPEPAVDFMGFGADSLDFRVRAILRDINEGMGVRTELRHQIVERFAEEGIEIPFAQRDVWIRNPETLRANAADRVETTGDTSGDTGATA